MLIWIPAVCCSVLKPKWTSHQPATSTVLQFSLSSGCSEAFAVDRWATFLRLHSFSQEWIVCRWAALSSHTTHDNGNCHLTQTSGSSSTVPHLGHCLLQRRPKEVILAIVLLSHRNWSYSGRSSVVTQTISFSAITILCFCKISVAGLQRHFLFLQWKSKNERNPYLNATIHSMVNVPNLFIYSDCSSKWNLAQLQEFQHEPK